MRVNRLEKVGAEERNNRYCVEIRRTQSDHDCQSERREQVLAHSKKKGYRKEHHDGDKHDGQYSQSNLVGTFDGRYLWVLAKFEVPR